MIGSLKENLLPDWLTLKYIFLGEATILPREKHSDNKFEFLKNASKVQIEMTFFGKNKTYTFRCLSYTTQGCKLKHIKLDHWFFHSIDDKTLEFYRLFCIIDSMKLFFSKNLNVTGVGVQIINL